MTPSVSTAIHVASPATGANPSPRPSHRDRRRDRNREDADLLVRPRPLAMRRPQLQPDPALLGDSPWRRSRRPGPLPAPQGRVGPPALRRDGGGPLGHARRARRRRALLDAVGRRPRRLRRAPRRIHPRIAGGDRGGDGLPPGNRHPRPLRHPPDLGGSRSRSSGASSRRGSGPRRRPPSPSRSTRRRSGDDDHPRCPPKNPADPRSRLPRLGLVRPGLLVPHRPGADRGVPERDRLEGASGRYGRRAGRRHGHPLRCRGGGRREPRLRDRDRSLPCPLAAPDRRREWRRRPGHRRHWRRPDGRPPRSRPMSSSPS